MSKKDIRPQGAEGISHPRNVAKASLTVNDSSADETLVSQYFEDEPCRSFRCQAGGMALVIDPESALAGQIVRVVCHPANDIGQPWRTAQEISLALQSDWVIELRAAPQRINAYRREFETNLFLLQDRQLVPLDRSSVAPALASIERAPDHHGSLAPAFAYEIGGDR
jgi:hypothetical protein